MSYRFGQGKRHGTAAAIVVAVGLGAVAPGQALANTTPMDPRAPILETPDTWRSCTNPLITRPFSRFSDSRDYVLAPSGDFEDASMPGWRLTRGAGVVAGSEPYGLGGKLGAKSLRLPPGASVTSPAMCVDLNYPDLRFMNRVIGNAANAEILVEIAYPDSAKPVWEEAIKFDGKQGQQLAQGWRLSDDVHLKPDLGGKAPGGRRVALRFTALTKPGSGEWRLDALYVDPRRH